MNDFSGADLGFMSMAMQLAHRAAERGEVPVGAVLVMDGEVIASGCNAPIRTSDATAHAEILTIRQACDMVNNYRLPGTTLYVTLEPCAMCAGAIVHARIDRVVIAAREPRAGAGGSVMNVLRHPELNHNSSVEFGLMKDESSSLLKNFFQKKRTKT